MRVLSDGERQFHRLFCSLEIKHNWHRYYDPSTGRYLTPDPIGLAGGDVNLYSYALQNPINYIDPFGLEYSKLNTTPYDIDYGGTGAWAPPKQYPMPNIGPFGPTCGSEGSVQATWIPDLSPSACKKHDDCYENCAKNCEGEDCRLKCDNQLKRSNPPYGTATDLFGKKTYDKLKEENGCDECK